MTLTIRFVNRDNLAVTLSSKSDKGLAQWLYGQVSAGVRGPVEVEFAAFTLSLMLGAVTDVTIEVAS